MSHSSGRVALDPGFQRAPGKVGAWLAAATTRPPVGQGHGNSGQGVAVSHTVGLEELLAPWWREGNEEGGEKAKEEARHPWQARASQSPVAHPVAPWPAWVISHQRGVGGWRPSSAVPTPQLLHLLCCPCLLPFPAQSCQLHLTVQLPYVGSIRFPLPQPPGSPGASLPPAHWSGLCSCPGSLPGLSLPGAGCDLS